MARLFNDYAANVGHRDEICKKNPEKFSTPAANPCVSVTREGRGAGLLTLLSYRIMELCTQRHQGWARQRVKQKPAYRRDRLAGLLNELLSKSPSPVDRLQSTAYKRRCPESIVVDRLGTCAEREKRCAG